METAEVVIKDILQEILAQANEQAIEAVDFQFVVRYMNRYMAQLSVTTPLGYTRVSKPTDLITIADGAIEGLIFNVALRIITSYDIQPGPMLLMNAKDGLATMRKLSRNPVRTRHPSTLPIGSGNECYLSNSRFYPGEEDTILTEQNGAILIEDGTPAAVIPPPPVIDTNIYLIDVNGFPLKDVNGFQLTVSA